MSRDLSPPGSPVYSESTVDATHEICTTSAPIEDIRKCHLFSCGRGEFGRLGHGDELDKHVPEPILAMKGFTIKQVACGYRHSMVLTKSGQVFAFGRAGKGRLGLGQKKGQENVFVPKPVALSSQVPIKHIAAGGFHTILIADKFVFTFGGGKYGKLGHGDEVSIGYPKSVSEFEGVSIRQGDAGEHHSLIVTEDGKIYSFGNGSRGQLGHGDRNDVWRPRQITALSKYKVVQAAAGAYHSVALTSEGTVYTFGPGSYGRLGHNERTSMSTPHLVAALVGKRAIQVAAGNGHTVVLIEDGTVYSFGNSDFGQLGHCITMESVFTPAPIEALKEHRITYIATGYNHTICISDDGYAFSFGKGEYGRLGRKPVDYALPKKITALKNIVKKAFCGGQHTILLTGEIRAEHAFKRALYARTQQPTTSESQQLTPASSSSSVNLLTRDRESSNNNSSNSINDDNDTGTDCMSLSQTTSMDCVTPHSVNMPFLADIVITFKNSDMAL